MREEEIMLSFRATDFVVASAREQRVAHVTITPDASNILARGTVLANDGDGTYSALTSANVDDAEVILAEDIEAGNSDVVATVYISGDFVREGLTAGYALSEAAVTNLKKAGIYLTHGIRA